MVYISILDFMKRKNFTPEEIQSFWDRSFGGARTKYGTVGSAKPMTEEGLYYTADLWTWEYYWPTEPFPGKQPECIYLKAEPNLQNKLMPMNLLNIRKDSETIESVPEGSDVTTDVPKSNHQPHPVVASQFNLPTVFDFRSPSIQNTVSSTNAISGNGNKPSEVKLPKERKVLPQGRCAECDSDQHSLANHPNANSTDGYLHGCVRCNTKGHEMNNCPKAPISFNSKEWSWYRVYRANKAPLWDFRDFRELKRFSAGYNLQKHVPWSPNFAKKARYKDEKNYSPEKTDQFIRDPFFKRGSDHWRNLGSFGDQNFPAGLVRGNEREEWNQQCQARRDEIRLQLGDSLHKSFSKEIQVTSDSHTTKPNVALSKRNHRRNMLKKIRKNITEAVAELHRLRGEGSDDYICGWAIGMAIYNAQEKLATLLKERDTAMEEFSQDQQTSKDMSVPGDS